MKRRYIDNKVILEMRNQGKSFEEIGRYYGISKVAAWKRFKKLTKGGTTELGPDKSTLHKPNYNANQRYLRKIGTNEIFAYSDMLMRRGDMVPYEGPIPMPVDAIPEHEKPVNKGVSEDL